MHEFFFHLLLITHLNTVHNVYRFSSCWYFFNSLSVLLFCCWYSLLTVSLLTNLFDSISFTLIHSILHHDGEQQSISVLPYETGSLLKKQHHCQAIESWPDFSFKQFKSTYIYFLVVRFFLFLYSLLLHLFMLLLMIVRLIGHSFVHRFEFCVQNVILYICVLWIVNVVTLQLRIIGIRLIGSGRHAAFDAVNMNCTMIFASNTMYLRSGIWI